MKRTKVAWSEGLLLTPQHFQCQDRYHEDRTAELFRAARPFGYGFTHLVLDEDGIRNGRVALSEATGVLPGGTPFAIPIQDALPDGLSVEEQLSATQTEVPVYLGLRVHRPGEAELAPPAAERVEVRYREGLGKFADQTRGGDAREVGLAHPYFRLLFPGEGLGDYETLPMALVVRKAEGGFGFRPDFVPPCLAVGASPFVKQVVRRLLEILVAKSTELSDRRKLSGKGVAEFGRDDTAGFWLLATVNGHIPVLSHLLRAGTAHPEEAYLILARLAGELTTLSDSKVRDIPAYDHDHPGKVFGDLLERVPKLLETVLPRHYTRIELSPRADGSHVGQIQDDRLLDPAVSLYLGVYANVPTGELQTGFPEMVKIASPDRIDALLAAALRGVEVRLVQTLPAALPAQAGWAYFQIEKRGEFWDGVAGAHAIGIYAPPEYVGIKMELIAVSGS